MILDLQDKLLSFSPALYPLLTFPLSFFQSWHCTVMCSPYLAPKSTLQRNFYLQGRLVSYTSAGAVFGGLGEGLRKLLEVKAVGAFAFFVFAILTVSLASIWFGSKQRSFHFPKLNFISEFFNKGRAPSFVQGLLSVALPCGILYQIMSLCAISNSVWGGALIGFVHATASAPALWSGTWVALQLSQSRKWVRNLVYVGISVLMIFNLLYFAGSLLHTEEVAKTKWLFCF